MAPSRALAWEKNDHAHACAHLLASPPRRPVVTAARLVARCVRGLESVLAEEILGRGLGTVTAIGHREVHFTGSPTTASLLRTADDAFLFASSVPDIGRGRAALSGLRDLVEAIDPAAYGAGDIEVSASFLGRRNFSRYDAEDVVGAALARRFGARHHSRRGGAIPPPGCAGWRLTLDGTAATLLRRVGERPLHRRPYKARTVPGTLHPPVAAAMARLADIQPGQLVVDPCCGAGTTLIEAACLQPAADLRGLDIAPAAIEAARENAAPAADIAGAPTIRRGDAGRLPFRDGAVDRVICNPPWGSQVGAGGVLRREPERWWSEVRRVLTGRGVAVLLLPGPADLVGAVRHGLAPVLVRRIRLSGAEPLLVKAMKTPVSR